MDGSCSSAEQRAKLGRITTTQARLAAWEKVGFVRHLSGWKPAV